jgi:hypothetical protein
MTEGTETLGVDHPDTITSLWSLAHDLIKLDRGAAAVPLLDECLRRAVGKRVHRNFPETADFRLRQFERVKDAPQCRTTAEMWEKQRRTDADSLNQAAICRAVTSAVSHATRLANVEADRAMAWLNNAVTAGFDDPVAMKTDRDLDALRLRPEFQMLMLDVAFLPDPFAHAD